MFDGKTKFSEILAKFPWLSDELVKIDSRLSVIKTPVGKMLTKNATVADLCKKAGISVDDALKKLQELIDARSGK